MVPPHLSIPSVISPLSSSHIPFGVEKVQLTHSQRQIPGGWEGLETIPGSDGGVEDNLAMGPAGC